MSALHAARVAARLREELGVDPERVHGRYGEFRVLVDGEELLSAGGLAFLGVMPPVEAILANVRDRLASGRDPHAAPGTGSSRR